MSSISMNGLYKLNSVQSPKAAKVSNPRWDVIPHKGMKRPTEADFEVIIDNLAKGLAEARYNNDDNKYNSISALKDKVYAQYVSVASPDRKALSQDAMQFLSKSQSVSSTKSTTELPNLIDFLNEKDKIGTNVDGCFSAKLKFGAMIFTGSDLQPNTFELKLSSSGQSVMGYNPNGWTWTATSEEKVLCNRFLKRINAAEDGYYQQLTNHRSPDNVGEKNKNTDIKRSVNITV